MGRKNIPLPNPCMGKDGENQKKCEGNYKIRPRLEELEQTCATKIWKKILILGIGVIFAKAIQGLTFVRKNEIPTCVFISCQPRKRSQYANSTPHPKIILTGLGIRSVYVPALRLMHHKHAWPLPQTREV